LPVEHIDDFIDMKGEIVTHRANVLLSSNFRPSNPATGTTTASSSSSSVNTAGRERITHTIRQGENLGTIARRYGVTTANLQSWNNMGSSTRIVAGRTLIVWVPARNATNTTTQTTTAAAAANSQPTASSTTTTATGNTTYYTVRQGDTIWSIAQKYNGVSTNDILSWNNLNNNSVIRPGMRLRIIQ
jgi:membrane-bound lytic murein transglycosylase D